MQTTMATPAAVNTLPTFEFRKISIGERIYAAGDEGIAWRVRSGAVRLDRVTQEGSNYAGLALRAGEAFERVRQLCLLLARYRDDGGQEITIPELRDMAAITNLTEATVSRAMSRLRRMGLLQRRGRRHGLMQVADPALAI